MRECLISLEKIKVADEFLENVKKSTLLTETKKQLLCSLASSSAGKLIIEALRTAELFADVFSSDLSSIKDLFAHTRVQTLISEGSLDANLFLLHTEKIVELSATDTKKYFLDHAMRPHFFLDRESYLLIKHPYWATVFSEDALNMIRNGQERFYEEQEKQLKSQIASKEQNAHLYWETVSYLQQKLDQSCDPEFLLLKSEDSEFWWKTLEHPNNKRAFELHFSGRSCPSEAEACVYRVFFNTLISLSSNAAKHIQDIRKSQNSFLAAEPYLDYEKRVELAKKCLPSLKEMTLREDELSIVNKLHCISLFRSKTVTYEEMESAYQSVIIAITQFKPNSLLVKWLIPSLVSHIFESIPPQVWLLSLDSEKSTGENTLWYLCRTPEGRTILAEKIPIFFKKIPPESWLGGATSGVNGGKNALWYLCNTLGGLAVLVKQSPEFFRSLSRDVWLAAPTSGIFSGINAFWCLCSTREGCSILARQSTEFFESLSIEVWLAAPTSGNFSGISAFWGLCSTSEGRAILAQQSPRLFESLPIDVWLNVPTSGKVSGISALWCLCSTSEGRAILARQSVGFFDKIPTEAWLAAHFSPELTQSLKPAIQNSFPLNDILEILPPKKWFDLLSKLGKRSLPIMKNASDRYEQLCHFPTALDNAKAVLFNYLKGGSIGRFFSGHWNRTSSFIRAVEYALAQESKNVEELIAHLGKQLDGASTGVGSGSLYRRLMFICNGEKMEELASRYQSEGSVRNNIV